VRIENCAQCDFTILDVYGNMRYQKVIDGNIEQAIDTKGWSEGLYIIKLRERDANWGRVEKLILLR